MSFQLVVKTLVVKDFVLFQFCYSAFNIIKRLAITDVAVDSPNTCKDANKTTETKEVDVNHKSFRSVQKFCELPL